MRTAIVLVATLALVAVLVGCSDETRGEESTLKLTEPGGKEASFGVIGQPTPGKLKPGSGFAFSTPLQDSSKKSVGELNAICIATQPSSPDALKGTCTGTAKVPDGDLALNVGGTISNGVGGSIVGGDGKYAGATGTFTSKPIGGGDNGASVDTFEIILP